MAKKKVQKEAQPFMASIKKLKPIYGKVLILPNTNTEYKTDSGIIVLKSASRVATLTGKVVVVGEGCLTKPGDEIWFKPGIGTTITEGKDTFLIIEEEKCECSR